MTVQTLRLDANRETDVVRAAEVLRRGGLVAFPTETVYGLGANALDPSAVSAIFAAKGRPAWDPLIVHAENLVAASSVADLGPPPVAQRAQALASAFWPGPLTMLLPRAATLPPAVSAGRERVGVRVPAHPVAQALLRHAGVPVAAPSANRFGYTSPTTAQHVLADLDGRIDAVLDGGSTFIGVESTVLDVVAQPMRVYRPGAVSRAAIEAVAGPVEVTDRETAASISATDREGLPSPGFGLRHYAPRTRLILVADARELLQTSQSAPGAIGVMLPDGWEVASGARIYRWGPWDRPFVLAQRLFAGLRELDASHAELLVCPLPAAEDGLRSALRDRLKKAAMQPEKP